MEGPGKDQKNNSMMTSSYHEIWESGDGGTDDDGVEEEEGDGALGEGAKRLLNKARNWVGDLSLEGVVSQQGHQLTYVKQDIHKSIQQQTPITTPPQINTLQECVDDDNISSDPGQTSDLNLIINEMELEAKKLASSVDTLTENLTGILHSLSSMTVDCVFAGSDGVSQLCDTADASIKVMYQVMAKSEELNKAVAPIYQVHQQIKDTKKLLDKVEAEIN